MKSKKVTSTKSYNLALPDPLQEFIIFEDIKALLCFLFIVLL